MGLRLSLRLKTPEKYYFITFSLGVALTILNFLQIQFYSNMFGNAQSHRTCIHQRIEIYLLFDACNLEFCISFLRPRCIYSSYRMLRDKISGFDFCFLTGIKKASEGIIRSWQKESSKEEFLMKN